MLFSSIPFLYYFLPCVLIVYFILPKTLKNAWIMLSSFFFYGWGEPRFLLIMIASIAQGYVFALLIERFSSRPALKKLFLALSCIVALGLLGYFKYVDFFISSFNAVTGLSVSLLNIALPIGISFFTFQIVSYDIDVYRGDVAAQKNPIDLAAYISMFSQLIAGPIVRYSDVAAQLKSRTHSIEKFSSGVRRFVIGLSKKMLIANVLGELVSDFKASDEKSLLFFWLYAVAYTLHIYFDFSGYSDMAIGLGRMMGFEFIENFNYPYIAASITDFWRRWHISLSTWFRDYVYIPLGGNRVGKLRWVFNIFVVWFLTGLWHGAAWNFALWGLLYAILLMNEKLWSLKLLGKSKVISHIYTLLFVIIGFVLFDASSLGEAAGNIASLFGFGGRPLVSTDAVYALRSYAVVFIIGIIGATPLAAKLMAKLRTNEAVGKVINVAEPFVLVLLLAVCTAYMVDGAFNPFLYFRF